MPNLNVITWNSTGENPKGASDLQGVIKHLVSLKPSWQPHVIVIQEANATSGGPICKMLEGLGGAYHQPPAHTTEGGSGGRGYLLTTHTSVAVQNTFTRADLATDAPLQKWISDNLSLPAQKTAKQELGDMRMPATASLSFQGRNMGFLTWHVPRGPGRVLTSLTLKGGANPDAYLFLQNSGIYQPLIGPGMDNLGVIAGDLNVTVAQINGSTGEPVLPRILPNWIGVSDKLDHILGHPQAGQQDPVFTHSGHYPASGDHNILVSTVSW